MAGKSYGTKVGDRFGKRVVTGFLLERDPEGQRRVTWRCDCGAMGICTLKSLRHTKSCKRCYKPSGGKPTHGHAGGWRHGRKNGGRSHLYDAWANMLQRVRGTGSPSNKRWYKGVTLCPEWQKFENFRDWAEACGYEPGLSLDRIFTCRGYEPSNCEWVTGSENSRRAAEDTWRRYDHTPIEMLWGET